MFLDEACSDDGLLRAEVESILTFYESADNLPESLPPPETAPAPKTIGPYRLERELGTGGMGQVWLAEQSQPVHRWVALKLIRAGLYDATVVQRFLAERQSLALMNHPAIAKVFDAGTTRQGQPYFVMEYVDGLPITEYCDRAKLGIPERLRLFLHLCEGVQHAHQKAVIHRDLKPSNILVVEVDGKPVPRIIDFGLAKAVSPPTDGETMLTQLGALLGTPGYMSPEQVDPLANDIDTRADVYALGVVLYELLTGLLPFDAKNWKKRRFDEVLRELREGDAVRPSTKVVANRETPAHSAEARSVGPAQLATLLRGDLDWITMKALEKDRERRYGTPTELAGDIGRYLRNLPVTARPASAGYRLRKYLRRNRVGVSVTAGAILLLLVFAAAQAVQLRRTIRERDRADRITSFLTGMFKVSDPSEARGNTVTAREVLDKSSTEIEAGLEHDAEVRSKLIQVMAQTYQSLGLYSRAHSLAELALEARMRTLGTNNPQTLESMTQMGWILYREGRDTEAEQMLRKSVDLQKRTLGAEAPLTLDTEDDLAIVLSRQGHFADEEKIEREVLAIKTRKFGPEDAQTLRSENGLASALSGQNRYPEAEKVYRQLLVTERRTLGDGNPFTLATMHNLANSLLEQGRFNEAEKLYRETLAVEERVLGPDHPDTADTLTTLANTIRSDYRRHAEAEALYRKAIEIETRTVGPEHPRTTAAKEGLANLLTAERHYPQAEKLIREILAIRLRLLGHDHTDTLLSQYNLANILQNQGRHGDAEKVIRETLASQTRVFGEEDADTLASKALLAMILIDLQRPREAEELARQAFEAQLRILGPQHYDTLASLRYLAFALDDMGRYAETRQLYRNIVEETSRVPGGDTSSAWFDLTRASVRSGHREDAFASLHQAIQAGYDNPEEIRTEVDLKSLRNDPRFDQAVKASQKREAEEQIPK